MLTLNSMPRRYMLGLSPVLCYLHRKGSWSTSVELRLSVNLGKLMHLPRPQFPHL